MLLLNGEWHEFGVAADMRLPADKTCADCSHLARCVALFGCASTNRYCDWSPSRFVQRAPTIVIPADKQWSPYP